MVETSTVTGRQSFCYLRKICFQLFIHQPQAGKTNYMNITNLYEQDIMPGKPQNIVLNTSRGIVTVSAQQIIRIQAISNYSKLFFDNGKSLVVAKVLRWFEEQEILVPFVRIHRSHLLNLQYIKSYSGDKEGLISLHTGETFLVAKRKKSAISRRLRQCIPVFGNQTFTGLSFDIKKTIAA